MRKTLAAAMLLALVAACGTEEKEVRHVAQHYLDATARYDIPDACNYCTPETANALRLIDSVLMPNTDSSYIKKNMSATLEITSLDINTDTTAVVSYHKHSPVEDFDGKLNMVRRDGQWMAHVEIVIPSYLRSGSQQFTYDTAITHHLRRVEK